MMPLKLKWPKILAFRKVSSCYPTAARSSGASWWRPLSWFGRTTTFIL